MNFLFIWQCVSCTCWSSRCAASPRRRCRVSAPVRPRSQRSIWRQEGRPSSNTTCCGRNHPQTAAKCPVTHTQHTYCICIVFEMITKHFSINDKRIMESLLVIIKLNTKYLTGGQRRIDFVFVRRWISPHNIRTFSNTHTSSVLLVRLYL